MSVFVFISPVQPQRLQTGRPPLTVYGRRIDFHGDYFLAILALALAIIENERVLGEKTIYILICGWFYWSKHN